MPLPEVRESTLYPTPFDRFLDAVQRMPFGDFPRMRRLMSGMLAPGAQDGGEGALWDGVSVDIYEKDDAYVVEAAAPGYKKEDLNVEVKGDTLIVSGKYERKAEEEKQHYHRREVRRGNFERSFSFPAALDPKSVTAAYKDGVLHVSVKPEKPIASTKVTIA